MKRTISTVLTVILLLIIGAVGYAEDETIKTEKDAVAAARAEIEVWKELGLLQNDVFFKGEPSSVVEIEPSTGNERWYGREFPHAFEVRWAAGIPIGTELEMPAYGCNLRMDAVTGRIISADIEALASESAAPVEGKTVEVEADDPDHPGMTITKTFYFYDNFNDIFPAELTVDKFCTLLAEYWGFSGYTLAETRDAEYYDEPQSPVAADTLLKDIPAESDVNYYLTIFFDGDQEGAPVYLSLRQLPGRSLLSVGITHAVG